MSQKKVFFLFLLKRDNSEGDDLHVGSQCVKGWRFRRLKVKFIGVLELDKIFHIVTEVNVVKTDVFMLKIWVLSLLRIKPAIMLGISTLFFCLTVSTVF